MGFFCCCCTFVNDYYNKGHLYCKSCLESYLQCSVSQLNVSVENNSENEYICPSCRTPIESTQQSQWVKRKIMNLRMKCPNNAVGCKWISEISNFKNHITNECKYIVVECKHCHNHKINNKNNKNINSKFFRKDIELHLSQCLYHPTDCSLCKMSLLRINLNKHKKNECIMRKIQCPQMCKKTIIAKHLNLHISKECENTKVDCPYSIYGCQKINSKNSKDNGKIARKHLRKHLINFQILHLELKVIYLERLVSLFFV